VMVALRRKEDLPLNDFYFLAVYVIIFCKISVLYGCLTSKSVLWDKTYDILKIELLQTRKRSTIYEWNERCF